MFMKPIPMDGTLCSLRQERINRKAFDCYFYQGLISMGNAQQKKGLRFMLSTHFVRKHFPPSLLNARNVNGKTPADCVKSPTDLALMFIAGCDVSALQISKHLWDRKLLLAAEGATLYF
eukprot:GILJ01028227.1.p1 GENE.GILJ01028227.1~~GILJ01028227.1.p1  ORF type:complete len:119 (-),score=6.87 GILJ01028227.1:37-393(-)